MAARADAADDAHAPQEAAAASGDRGQKEQRLSPLDEASGAVKAGLHMVTVTPIENGRILCVDGRPAALDVMGGAVIHRGEHQIGPFGSPQAVRLRNKKNIVMCVECLHELGPVELLFDSDGVAAPECSTRGAYPLPFIRIFGGKTSAFTTHRATHKYGALRELRKRARDALVLPR